MGLENNKSMNSNYSRVVNFSAGPAVLPESVLERARDEFMNLRGAGCSILEISHRSKEFLQVIEEAKQNVRELLGVPQEYEILFLQGGASLQFVMAPMNLYLKGHPIEIIHSGYWVKKAIGEIKKVAEHKIVVSGEEPSFKALPNLENITFNSSASYLYMCSNNTIAGTQWKKFPNSQAPLVVDMSSDILSRKIDIKQFGMIFSGAQKNLGPSGLALVIIRKDLAERASKDLPTFLQYRTHIEADSAYNTPNTFAIYFLGLVLDWIKSEGGLGVIEKRNEEKAKLIYDVLDRSDFYNCPIPSSDRSLMNVVFKVRPNTDVGEKLESQFVEEATKAGFVGLKGHRSVGGLRASIYNAMGVDSLHDFSEFMRQFEKKNG